MPLFTNFIKLFLLGRRVLRDQELLPPDDLDAALLRALRRRRLHQVPLGQEVGAQPEGNLQMAEE